MSYDFRELVDVAALQELTDELYAAAAIPSSIITMTGEILTGSGWQRICTDFHRAHPRVEKECIASDTALRRQIADGEPFVIYRCPRGLTDASAPVVVAGEHVANVFAGQVFLEPPDASTERFFREQARRFGFDEEAYMQAFLEIPVFTPDRFRGAVIFIAKLAQLIADMGATRLNELRAMQALRASEAKYRTLVENANDAIFIAQQGRLTYVNRKTAEISGYAREELLAGPFERFIHPQDRSLVLDRHRRRERGEAVPTTYEFRIVTPSGDTRWVELNAVRGDWEQEAATLNFLRDITERKRAEAEIRTFKSMSDAAVHGNAIADLNGTLIYVNDAFARVHGYRPAELTGRHLAVFHNEQQLADVHTINRSLQEKGRFGPLEVWHTHRDGTEFPMLMSGVLLRDGRGEPQYMAASGVDISDRKALEHQLQQAQKLEAVGTLAGGIAHDFNNILFPIVGMAELLLEDLPADSPEHANVAEILAAGRRGSDLVKQILAFSRQSDHQRVPIRVQRVLAEALRLSRATIPSDIAIEQQIDTGCGRVLADPTQLHQIVMNVVTNAYHAVEASGGTITVRLEERELASDDAVGTALQAGRYARLAVADTGCGIDPAIRDKIFEPYFTTKERGKGSGLGLAVVYGIVKEHRGDIVVHSVPGRGTTVEVYLPILEAARDAEPTAPAAVPDVPGGTERILLVDDEAAIVRLQKQLLEKQGYRVMAFHDSREALDVFRATPAAFDLVVSDMTMPHLTGDRLAGAILAIRPGMPVVVCTGFSERLTPDQARRLGIRALLMKPVAKADLTRTVRSVLDEVTPGTDRNERNP